MEYSIDSFLPEIIKLREHIHTYPEISYEEYETTKLIEETITSSQLEFKKFSKLKTGGYCDVGEGETIVFRADIDALPITENPENKVVSKNHGIMHACGHDYHTAIGLGLLKYFGANKINKKLRVVFQPAEEAAPGGAESVIAENILDKTKCAIALHVDPKLPVGKFDVIDGAVQASTTSIKIELTGPGGHTSKPAETVDLINVTSYYVVQIQSYLRQNIDPRETLAFAFGAINGGTTHNTIPEKISLRGTIRTHNNEVLDKCFNLMKSFTKNFSELNGIKINIEFPTSCPATINNSELTKSFINFMKNTGREENLILAAKPSMGADDFAFYGLKLPSLYLQVGAGGKGSLHTTDLELDDEVLRVSLETLIDFFEQY